MELPHLGDQCSNRECQKLNFLPIKCDACKLLFCEDHYNYSNHNCTNSYMKNNQVPVCPLCNKPIPVERGLSPDAVVGAHIDSDCQSDPAKSRRKVFTNRCSFKKCKNKELLPVVCEICRSNYCIKHRHPSDHACAGSPVKQHWMSKFQQLPVDSPSIQGNMSEDEALAKALALSLQDTCSKQSQEQIDLALARQLQASESQTVSTNRNSRDRCNVS